MTDPFIDVGRNRLPPSSGNVPGRDDLLVGRPRDPIGAQVALTATALLLS
jgi:hypothetical protein